MKLFELTNNKIEVLGRVLYQIRAIVDFNDVTKGDLGGWVEDKKSIGDNCWVYENAKVFAEAKIYGGTVYGGTVYGGTVYGGTVYGGTVYGGVVRGGTIHDGTIHGGRIYGGVVREGEIYDGTIHGGGIYGGVVRGGMVYGGTIYGGTVYGGVVRGGTIHDGTIHGGEIYEGVVREGEIYDGTIHGGGIYGGVITKENHIGFNNVGSENGYLLAYIDSGKIMISRGCFHGTIDEFYRKVEEAHKDNEHGVFYKSIRPIIEMKLQPFLNEE